MPNRTDPIELAHFAKIVESSDDAIISKDLDGTIKSWNRAAERMFGYPAQEAVGHSIRMIIPADRQTEEDLVLARIRAGLDVSHFETVRRRKDGSLVPISLTVSPIRDDTGRVIGASKIARDISERVRLEALAQEQVSITEKLSDVGAIVASSLDQETVVQRVTDVATDLTHAEFGAFFYNQIDPQSGEAYTLYTLSGTSREAFATFPQPRATAIFAATFHGEGPMRLDDVTQDSRYGKNPPYHGMPDGHLPVRSYLAVPVTGADRRVLGGLFFGHSTPGVFTSQHERLATGIATWASVALENARLYDAARDADRLKDEFLAVLSHELRTPLNAIVGYTVLLRDRILQGEQVQQGLDTIARNANSLTQIVEDVLDISRIVSGKIRLDVQSVQLPGVIENAIATVRPAADAKGVQLEAMLDSGVDEVSGDPDRLQQVIWNLLSNAVKFTPKHGRVQVRLERIDSHVEIVVSDTGVGIPPAFIAHVFERFRQADAGTARKTGGLGLGLSIVKHIVEMHGGTIDVSSAGEGQGATFRVRLPLRLVAPHDVTGQPQHPLDTIGQPQHPHIQRTARFSTAGDLQGVRVLAIDDEQDALALLRFALEAAGATVTTAPSASIALERLAAVKPHVLVADLGMPYMDGFEFIARVRALPDPELRDVPAAALTAFARSEDRTKALRSGFEMHLAKPVDPGELVASVASLARRARHLKASE